ncbi:hypothetical protein OU798_02645 [Prolixibacteraceae bacterium Z1-6]|uniref:NERD domain-containing protein n=1 Tax=Draconibacterium aestuarii TaxID=2998507 RepID=A0A9X3J3B1_9BACT|nr:hypothetical protein [Prolixibacteraceae bacterium Z1-6]
MTKSRFNNIAEEYVNFVNDNIFLKEFTYSDNEIRIDNGEIELADNIVWVDNFLFLIQIKHRNTSEAKDEQNEIRWFKNKIERIAKRQIKQSIRNILENPDFKIISNSGNEVGISNMPIENAKKIIIYLSSENLPDKQKAIKFYESKDVGLIHLLHMNEYKWLCEYIITITEIDRYLEFREGMFRLFGNQINEIPEQLIFGKYVSGDEISTIDLKYIKFYEDFDENIYDFNFLPYLSIFKEKIIGQKHESDYLFILRNIIKLTRHELKEFKIRFDKSIEISKAKIYHKPFRFSVPRIDCTFLFVPIDLENTRFRGNCVNLLDNLSDYNMYDQAMSKSVSVAIYRNPESIEFIEIVWNYKEKEWQRDKEMEKHLDDYYPFRETKINVTGGYKTK